MTWLSIRRCRTICDGAHVSDTSVADPLIFLLQISWHVFFKNNRLLCKKQIIQNYTRWWGCSLIRQTSTHNVIKNRQKTVGVPLLGYFCSAYLIFFLGYSSWCSFSPPNCLRLLVIYIQCFRLLVSAVYVLSSNQVNRIRKYRHL